MVDQEQENARLLHEAIADEFLEKFTGLASGLWTNNLQRAHRFSDGIRAGMVWVNCYKRVHPASPFGGVGESGYGRDMGIECLQEYTSPKAVWINYDAQIPPFYQR